MPRLFVGVFLPDEVKEPVLDFQGSLAKMPMRMKPVEPGNLHISLVFLGERRDDEVKKAAAALDDVCGRYKRFTVKIGGGMVIPNESYIRVVALGVRSGGDVLESLRNDIVGAVGGDSHPAHLTLARVRDVSDKVFVAGAVTACKAEFYFEVGSVCLVKSVLKGDGPRYTVVHESRLG